ncbi:HNH endonuclease [Streptomyces sp. OF3]|uniref:HNH endonuclease n=1 Tax=Streptomyces alkaliterrae TaxID=2213162 RepID=A0A7W3WIZ1_9ACTN|nr:HNH endonuclease [Streptomyces alkaliterrae]MBB1253184.1 HNH endonuclease [Streptomyces alkaliterrae]
MSGNWERSDRAKRLPPGWKRIRARILARDPVCALCGVRPSTHCDHIHAKTDDHSDTGLQGVCGPCHDAKSSREGNAAPRTRPGRRRPPEPHPGMR